MEIKKILIPNKPHLDPIAAIYLLRQYGQEKFPGISDAEIVLWEHSHDPSEKEGWSLENGILMIDMGGGAFDHHHLIGNTKETATSLVAAYLGIDNNPELSALLGYIREDDLEGLHNRYGDLAYVLKCMHKQNEPVGAVIEFALQTLKYLQASQKEWHHNVKNEFEQKVKLVRIKRFKKKLKIGIIESDSLQVGNYGLTVANLSAVIQKRSSGHVMILTNKHHRLDLREPVAAIRKKELELMGYDKEVDARKLQYEGKSQLIPNWFYHKSLNAFLNGSDALAKTEPARVPFKDIVRFVLYGLATSDSELCDCHQGGEKCPYRDYGFERCVKKINNY